MSFTSDVKREIIDRRMSLAERKASISAFVRTSGALGIVNGAPTFFLVSETEYVAEYFMTLFSDTFETDLSVTHATMDKKRGRDKLVLQCPSAYVNSVLAQLGLLKRGKTELREGILPSLIKTEEGKIAYIQGAFLGGGSCSIPSNGKGGYHLEIVFNERKTARDFCRLLDEFSLFAKLTQRKETFVAYMKSKEAISDFLAIVGAENTLKKFVAVLEKRDEANRDNRAKNCIAGNADKTAIAAVKQVVAIKKLHESSAFSGLSEELRTLAKIRLQYPQMSLRELAELMGIGKSCLNHRMRKLMEAAEDRKE